jgi:Raf kinase inhibitor-like YbhB/YbcL family protein
MNAVKARLLRFAGLAIAIVAWLALGGSAHTARAGMVVLAVRVMTGSSGQYLADINGMTLYVFSADQSGSGTSACNGPCPTAWPPAAVAYAPVTPDSPPGVVGSIGRQDGSQQLTYNGMPLYNYARDTSPGQTNGQGITAFGGTWTVATPLGSGAAPVAVGTQGAPTSAPMTISSTAFPNGSAIPAVPYACSDLGGSDKNPPLVFSNVPNNAQSLVLKVDDPDAPNGYNASGNYPQAIVHWLLYNIDPTTSSIPVGAAAPPGTAGLSYDGKAVYEGPCPPAGTHRYFFRLYALNGPISLMPNTSPTWPNVMTAMAGKVTACATLVGTVSSVPGQQPSNPALPAPPFDSLCPTQPVSNLAQPSQPPNNPGGPTNLINNPAQLTSNPRQPTQPVSDTSAQPVVQRVVVWLDHSLESRLEAGRSRVHP